MKQIYFSVLFTGMGLSAAAQWTITQDMFETRTQHVAVALNSDSLLVAGGWDFSDNLTTGEMYIRSLDVWAPTTNNMTSAHTTAAAVKLADGRVLVISGWDGSINTTSCDLYNPVTNTWTVAGSMAYGRSYHTATLLNDGRVLVVGGYTGAVNTPVCEIYNPATGTWSQTDSLATGRSYHTATLLNDGRVLVAGGYNPAAGFQLGTVEIFDPITNTWSSASSMGDMRAWHAASLLADGKVMVTGGEYFTGGSPFAYEGLNSAEVYNPAGNTWTAVADMPGGLCYNQQFSVGGDDVLVIAGVANTDYGSVFTTAPGATYRYHVSTNTWSNAAMNIDARVQFAAAQLGTGSVLVSGGDDNTAEIYDLPLSVMETAGDNQLLQLYPNPSDGRFMVSLGDGEKMDALRVFDITGKLVFEQQNINASVYQADLGQIEKGLYTVQISAGEKQVVKKAMVK